MVCCFFFSLSIILVSFFSFNLNSLSVMVISLLTWWWMLHWQWNTQTRRVRLGTPSTLLMFWRPMAAVRKRAFLWTVTLWTVWWAHRVRTGCVSEIFCVSSALCLSASPVLTGCIRCKRGLSVPEKLNKNTKYCTSPVFRRLEPAPASSDAQSVGDLL